MMYLYVGYDSGFLKHIYTSDKKLDFDEVECFECHTMNEVIYCLMTNEETKYDIVHLINDKDTFILKNWNIVISHKVLINSWGNKPQIWIENEQGELVLL